jgi:hypothetical protein
MSSREVPSTTNSSKFPLISPLHTNDSKCNGHCCKRLQHAMAKIVDNVLGMNFFLIGGLKGRTIVLLVDVESSMV